MVFDQSVRGLSAGAPIDFLGIEIGRVRSDRAAVRRRKRKRFPVEVIADIYPLRLGAVRGALVARRRWRDAPTRCCSALVEQRLARAAAHRQPADRPALRRARLHPQGAPGRRSTPAPTPPTMPTVPRHPERAAAADRRDRRAGSARSRSTRSAPTCRRRCAAMPRHCEPARTRRSASSRPKRNGAGRGAATLHGAGALDNLDRNVTHPTRRCSATLDQTLPSCSAPRRRCACSPTTCSSTPNRCCAANPADADPGKPSEGGR